MRPPVIAVAVVANGCTLIARKITGTVICLGSAGTQAGFIVHALGIFMLDKDCAPAIIRVPFAVHVVIVAVIAAFAVFTGKTIQKFAIAAFDFPGHAQKRTKAAGVYM